MSERDEETFEKNVENMIREGALPRPEERADESQQEFLRRLAESPVKGRKPHLTGVLTMAASLLVCATVLWMVLGGGQDKGIVESQEEDAAIVESVKLLTAEDPKIRHDSAARLVKLGDKTRPALAKAAGGVEAKLARRALALLALLDALGEGAVAVSKDPYVHVDIDDVGRDEGTNQFGGINVFWMDISLVLNPALPNLDEVKAAVERRQAKVRHIVVTEVFPAYDKAPGLTDVEKQLKWLAGQIRERANQELKGTGDGPDIVTEVLIRKVRRTK